MRPTGLTTAMGSAGNNVEFARVREAREPTVGFIGSCTQLLAVRGTLYSKPNSQPNCTKGSYGQAVWYTKGMGLASRTLKTPSHQASASTDGNVPQHFRRHAMPTLSVHKPITFTHGPHWRQYASTA